MLIAVVREVKITVIATNTELALTVYLSYLCIILINPHTILGNEYYDYYYYSHFSEEETDSKQLSDLYKVSEPVSGKSGALAFKLPL